MNAPLKGDINSILDLSGISIVILDNKLAVINYTPSAGTFFQLGPEQIGKPLKKNPGNISGNNYIKINNEARAALNKGEFTETEFKDVKGNTYIRKTVPVKSPKGKIIGVSISFIKISETNKKKEENNETNQKLAQSELSLLQTQRVTRVGSWHLDIETNQVEWTGELYRMFGFDPAKPPPPYTEHQKLFTPESWELLSTSLAKTRSEGIPYELELKTIKKDGSNGWMWVHGEAVKNENGKITALWGAAQDITEKKNTEGIFKNVFNLSVDLICTADINGYFRKISPSFTKTLGYTEDELLNNPFLEFIHPDDKEPTLQVIQQKLKKGEQVINFQNRYICKNGSIVWLDWISQPNVFENITFAVARDITESKNYEATVRESEKNYKTLFNNQTGAIAVHQMLYNKNGDPTNFIYIDGNEKLNSIMGMEREQYMNKKVTEVIPGFLNTHKDLFNTYAKVAQTGESTNFELYFNNFKRWFNVKAYSHKKGYFATITDDITPQKTILAQIENARKLNETLTETSPYGIVLYNEKGNCVTANQRAATLVGTTKQQLLKQNIHKIESWKKGNIYRDAIHTLKTGKETSNSEKITTTFGRQFWIAYTFITFEYNGEPHLTLQFQDEDDKVKQQEALSESEELFRLTFQDAPIGKLITSLDYKVLSVNKAFASMLGYTIKEFLNVDYANIFHPDDAGLKDKIIENLLAHKKGKFNNRKRYIHKHGHTVWADVSTIAQFDKNMQPKYFVTHVVDVTKQIIAENELKRSEEKYRAIAHHFPNGAICLYDKDFNYILADGMGLEQSGLSKFEMEGKNVHDIFPKETVDAILPPMQKALNGEPTTVEVPFDNKVYVTYYTPIVIGADEIICGMIMTQNITELKQKTKLLEESEARYKSMFYENRSVMLLIDPKTGQIVDANEAAAKYYGYKHSAITQMNINQINTLTTSEIKQEMQNALKDKKRFFQFKHKLANGTIRNVQVYSGKIDFNNRPLLYSIIHDNTAEIEAIKKLKRQTVQLIQAEKMNAIGTLTAGVAHELNNPLMGILNYAEYCQKHISKNNKAYPVLTDLIAETERSAEIVKALLSFSRKNETVKAEHYKTNLGNSIKECMRILKIKTKNKQINIKPDIGSVPVYGNIKPGYLQQVIFNIVDNSIFALESCKNKEIFIKLTQLKTSAIISITDTGKGIKPEYLQSIFDPFYTTKPVGKGTGLGLSICKNMLEETGGSLTCESVVGKGTTFKIKVQNSN